MSTPYYSDNSVTLYHGDCIEILRTLPDTSVDAVVTDPPYGLSFMGKDWDAPARMTGQLATGDETRGAFAYGGTHDRGHADHNPLRFQRWCTDWATECLRVLKPGGHMLAFGGSRTWHRLAAAVEDAGFEIRDSIAWLYGSGFPKSLDVSKAIATRGGRPEDIRRAAMGDDYAPSGRGRMNYDHGSGSAMNGSATGIPLTPEAQQWQGWGTALKPAFEPVVVARKPLAGTVAANVLAHGTGALNIDACRVPGVDSTRRVNSAEMGYHGGNLAASYETGSNDGRWPTNVVLDESQAAELDAQTGVLKSGAMRAGTERQARAGGTIYGADSRNLLAADTYGDEGGASRFFPVFRYEAKAPKSERPTVDGVAHPTVKPIALMQWLVRLVTPPGGTVLEPFAGSGTTAEACVTEGFRCIAIEREAEYLPLVIQRLSKPIQVGLDFDGGTA